MSFDPRDFVTNKVREIHDAFANGAQEIHFTIDGEVVSTLRREDFWPEGPVILNPED